MQATRQTADGVRIVGCNFPQSYARAPFFYRFIEVASNNDDAPLVLVGDFNTVRNDLDTEGRGARCNCADLFMALSKEAGLIDLCRARHGKRQEWTWRITQMAARISSGNRRETSSCSCVWPDQLLLGRPPPSVLGFFFSLDPSDSRLRQTSRS
jgi:hypothetical protein